jgi:hypothetical protein
MKHANASQICNKHIVPSHRSAMIYDEIVHAKKLQCNDANRSKYLSAASSHPLADSEQL